MDGKLREPRAETATGIEPQGSEKISVKEDEFILEAQDRAKVAVDGWNKNHQKWREDVDFVAGRQWPEEIKQQREQDERVVLTINQLPKYSRQVTGDSKQSRIQINVTPAETGGDRKIPNVAGTRDYSYAQVMQGIVRNIEAVSKAERAYDRALKHCVDGGFGWLRVIKRYARPDGFEQEFAIQAVRNPFSVLYDPQAMVADEDDFTGGTYAFVHSLVPRKAAEKRYGDKVTDVSITDETSAPQQWWYDKDDIRLAEYYYIESKDTLYVMLSDGAVMEAKDLEDAKAQALGDGRQVINHRAGEKRCVYWSLIDGSGILEGPFRWDGGFIPLIPVLGPELWLDDGVEYQSLFRHSHDAQRMNNYWHSAATETVALAPKAPWVADAASIAGYENDYERASREPIALLKYKARENIPPPKRAEMGSNPAAEISMAMHANDNVKSTIGIFDASLGQRSNETSGKAIIARQQEGDTGTFEWHDALAKAVEQVGRILVDIIPKVYDTERTVRVKLPEEDEDFVRINYKMDDGSGNLVKADLGQQRYDVAVRTGPSMGTQRTQAADSMMAFVQAIPDAARVVMDKIARNMDWPGADDIAERLKKIVPPELLSTAEREELQADAPEPPPPDPLAVAEAETEKMKAEADRMKAEADLIKAEADRITAEAKMLEAQNESPERIKDMVAEAIAEILPALIQPNGPETPVVQGGV